MEEKLASRRRLSPGAALGKGGGEPCGELSCRSGTLAAFRLEAAQALLKIDARAAKALFRQEDRKKTGLRPVSLRGRRNGHGGETRRQAELAHLSPLRGQSALSIECAEQRKQRPRFLQCRCRRLVDKGKCRRILNAPMGHVEHEAGKIACKEFRRCEGRKGGRLACVPEADSDTGLGTPRAPRALVGRGAGDPYRLEPGDAGRGFEDGKPLQPAVDDDRARRRW